MSSTLQNTLNIEVYFDFICPWCLIGKRQLDQALALLRAERPELQVALRWRGVQLLPYLPAGGEDFNAFYLQRLGGEQALRLRQAQVRQAAASVGVALDFTRIPRMPNTADAHRLWQRASELGSHAQQNTQLDTLLESLFACHFQQGGDLGDGQTLLDLAAEAGFATEALVSSLQGDGSPFLGTAEGRQPGRPQLRAGRPGPLRCPAGGAAARQPAPGRRDRGQASRAAHPGACRTGTRSRPALLNRGGGQEPGAVQHRWPLPRHR
ncbi:DsbA family oxidoreductase [Aeromonas sanarellii]|nr:DsbA family oxidoreductase [Aeromonas sanarellii]